MQYQFGTEDEFEALSDDRLVVTPTSRVTGDATPIELKLTDSMRFRFLPKTRIPPSQSRESSCLSERGRQTKAFPLIVSKKASVSAAGM